MRRKKRGVSPLIATVLLISFAVALGSVVLNWGRNLDLSSSEDACSQAQLEIRKFGDLEACYVQVSEKAFLRFTLDNKGSSPVAGLGIWIVGQKGTKLLDFDQFAIVPDGFIDIQDNSVEYDFSTYGSIKHVQFIPKVQVGDAVDICPANSVRAESIGIC